MGKAGEVGVRVGLAAGVIYRVGGVGAGVWMGAGAELEEMVAKVVGMLNVAGMVGMNVDGV